MKKKLQIPCLILIIFLLTSVYRLVPKDFDTIIQPYQNKMLHSYGDRPEYDVFLSASNNFGSNSSAFLELNEHLSNYSYRLDIRSLLPFLYQPQKRVDICIAYYTT